MLLRLQQHVQFPVVKAIFLKGEYDTKTTLGSGFSRTQGRFDVDGLNYSLIHHYGSPRSGRVASGCPPEIFSFLPSLAFFPPEAENDIDVFARHLYFLQAPLSSVIASIQFSLFRGYRETYNQLCLQEASGERKQLPNVKNNEQKREEMLTTEHLRKQCTVFFSRLDELYLFSFTKIEFACESCFCI